MSVTFFFHYTGILATGTHRGTALIRRSEHTGDPSSSHSLRRRTLLAMVSTSFFVSPAATAARTRTPLPMEETTSLSTVTDAERTLCIIAVAV